MNKKMQLVLDIMQLAVEISKNTKADVFVNYSGHVDWFDVRIYDCGWTEGCVCDYTKYIYLDTDDYRTEETIIETLNEIYAELANI